MAKVPSVDEALDNLELIVPTPPQFTSVEDERRHRLERLAGALRLFALLGFDEGVFGHFTARDPENTDRFWVNPLGLYFGHVRVSDLVCVTASGEIVSGNRMVNPAAFGIHSEIHAARPDVLACAHAHSTYGKSWSTLGRRLDPISQDSTAFFESHALFDHYPIEGVGKQIAQELGDNKAILLRNHGILTVGQSVDAAAWWLISMERQAQVQLLAEAAGTPQLIDPDIARTIGAAVGSELGGWFSFQPLWQRISREQPDLFE